MVLEFFSEKRLALLKEAYLLFLSRNKMILANILPDTSFFMGLFTALLALDVPMASSHSVTCKDLTLQVPIAAINTLFTNPDNALLPSTNTALTDVILDLVAGNTSKTASAGTVEINGTYQVGATFCRPQEEDDQGEIKGIQVLAHGIGFAREYWDFPEYSYTEEAVGRGWATFAYGK